MLYTTSKAAQEHDGEEAPQTNRVGRPNLPKGLKTPCKHTFSRVNEGRTIRHRFYCFALYKPGPKGGTSPSSTMPSCYSARCRGKCPLSRLPDERRGQSRA